MRISSILAFVLAAALSPVGTWTASAQDLSLSAINDAQLAEMPKTAGKPSPVLVKAQVLLARANVSPGVIDGLNGGNFKKAISAFQKQQELKPTGRLDKQTWEKLTSAAGEPVVTEYEITPEDTKGPFVERIPEKFEEMTEMRHLGFTGPKELLAEKFHMDQDLLQQLNPNAAFDQPGTKIVAANIRNGKPSAKAAAVVVAKKARTVRVLGEDDRTIAFYPASVGSKEKPAPSGEFKVRAIAPNPAYYYNPEFRFRGVKTDKPLKIAPGPNNPVGTVWVDLTKETYGIHGTPEPAKVGKTYSHGCVRLTNWDVEALAQMVGKGTPVRFLDE